MTARNVVWVGVDAGKEAHHATAVDAEGRALWSTRVLNDEAAIEALTARAGQAGDEVRWAVGLTCAAASCCWRCWWRPVSGWSMCPAGR